ncbi:hypothetical protein BDB00DRAFT_819504 [Zychaea mexicana]|uniref:uncharacterized protein n=1 Tax=Zychaea mexicana TaxID=64656 RepID=UPI0022FE51CB|nr:uncharacterized protein BDB00DRAFT_819504 [Zychaea mexicana]KAI9494280.1 hypothetical protein BDB00DRAFT_819504 [Zychaea mexicana]
MDTLAQHSTQQQHFQQQQQQQLQPKTWVEHFKEYWQKFNLANLLFCYCLPFFYLFYPALLMPAIFLRTLSFFIGWLYQLVLAHHKDPTTTARRRRQQRKHRSKHNTIRTVNNGVRGPGASSSSSSSSSSSRPVLRASSSSSTTTTTSATESGSDDNDAMEYWLQKCSICLSKRYALCLESCRDQFCKPCFQRYIEEIVHASWGLGVTRIKCPVCQESIKQSEWSRYVPSSLVDQYEKYNQPYRPFSRWCPHCRNHPIIPCQSPRSQGLSRQKRIERIVGLVDALQDKAPMPIHASSWLDPFRRPPTTTTASPITIGRIQTLYHQMTPVLRQAAQHPHLYAMASELSKQLVALEMVPEAWKRAQFWHVANFPVETCNACSNDMCLQCGEEAHSPSSCLDVLTSKLSSLDNSEEASTVRWKLENTRACPCCSVMINRDEGCNKVDCLFCGFQFCWSCRSGWSQQTCGFYQCREGGEQQEQQQEQDKHHDTRTELGVPNTEFLG